MAESRYWQSSMSRRKALRTAAAFGGGVGALSLIGCGNDEEEASSGASSSSSGGSPSSSGANTTGGSSAPSASSAADSTKGKPGGTFIYVVSSFPRTFLPFRNRINGRTLAFFHSGLLAYRAGRPGVPSSSLEVEPDAAQAMPEQTDDLTYVYKLRPGIKFHNGRVMTSEDVKYSLDGYRNDDESAFRSVYSWVDKVENPDPQTVVIKSKAPNAEAVQAMGIYNDAFILLKEHVESPQATEKLMGSGAWVWEDALAPVSINMKRNPDYFLKPYPYFDKIQLVVTRDAAKRVADFAAKATHMPTFMAEDDRDQTKRNRPDAVLFAQPSPAWNFYIKTVDKPYDDKRVRQALSMATDRKKIREVMSIGEGEDDQILSVAYEAYGFRKPSELKSAKYWKYDPAEAKKLFSAAGVQLPLGGTLNHWNAATGQQFIDAMTLALSNYLELGIADYDPYEMNPAEVQTTVWFGKYNGLAWGPNKMEILLGSELRRLYWSPPEGITTVPTTNYGFVNNPQLNTLLDKQLQQFKIEERKSTFREMEEIFGEEQYRVVHSTYSKNFFIDPSVKNVQITPFAFNGATDYVKYWWLDA